MRILADDEIASLLRDAKVLPDNWRNRLRTRPKSGFQFDQREVPIESINSHIGQALFTYIQAITRITDVSFLSRERVRSTFHEDFLELVSVAAGGRKVEFEYSHPVHDLEKRYPVDARINGTSDRQALLFGIQNDAHCRDATVILNRWERWNERFTAVALFHDQTTINRLVLARFSDVAERQFSSLDTARERLAAYLVQIFD